MDMDRVQRIATTSSSQPGQRRTSFATQANALLRKNLSFQKRNVKTNVCLVLFPIVLCVLLVLLQAIINNLLNDAKYRCGCKCLPQSGTSLCKETCGLEYSTSLQAGSCSISSPSRWPAFLQVPLSMYRAVKNDKYTDLPDASCRLSDSCLVTILYTGQNKPLSQAIAGVLVDGPIPSVWSDSYNVLAMLIPGTGTWTSYSNFIEPAVLSRTPPFVLQSNCASLPSSTVSASFQLGSQTLPITLDCVATQTLWRNNYSAINEQIYQGFRNGNPSQNIDEISVAYDFGETSANKFDVTISYNSSYKNNSGSKPPAITRASRPMNMVAQAFLRFVTGSPSAELPLDFIKEMPKPTTQFRLDFSSLLGPLFFMWVVQLLFPVILTSIVYEKENNLRMMMKMHGLGDGPYWLISYIYFLAISWVYVICFMVIGSLVGLNFFRLNAYMIQIIFYFVYANLQIAMSFLASTAFSSTTTATVVGYQYVFGFGLMGAFLFQSFVQDPKFSRGGVFALEILPGFALYRGLYEFSSYAFIGNYQGTKGMQWKNLGDNENGLKTVFGIMIVEWFLFLLLTYYIHQVVLSGGGVKKSPLVFIHSILGKREGTSTRQNIQVGGHQVNLQLQRADVEEERIWVEEMLDGRGTASSIICNDLKKIYPGRDGNPDKYAVRGLSLGVPSGECFGMLGPNGAGKTSSINMMIGLMRPTSGTAYVQGLDICKDMEKIYSCMGVCPQHDLLWETLTGKEHLLFYGRLKNLKGLALDKAVEDSLKSVNLFNGGVCDKRVGRYSGGMKRRLSVAISLIGNPKVVYMDEPSTGLDPASRSTLWNVVKQAKRDRAIILTTHSMEEAEVLCDRLGIFMNGQLQCIGNSRELKSRYGSTYVLTISTSQEKEEDVLRLVSGLSPNNKRIYNLSGTQKFELPKTEVKISDVFRGVESLKLSCNIHAWGISDTTLEDVFIKVTKERG